MTKPLGPQIFQFGTLAKFTLFKLGFKVKKGKKTIIEYWDDVIQLRFHWLKEKRLFITGPQYFVVWIDLKNGRTLQMPFQKFAALWGIDAYFHSRNIRKFINSLQNLPVPLYFQDLSKRSADMLEWELPED